MSQQFVVVFMHDASGATLPPDEEQKMHEAWAHAAERAGRLGPGAPIAGADAAKAVAERDGRILITDGPFPEFKEWFAGFAILEAETLDEAAALMAEHPSAVLGRILVAPVVALPWER
ncbi:transcription initiation protein [Microbacterium sp. 4R-513]|uniref:YciI family protein n=1 Tax=Microbacterium sp. 4R-513 TaxID=2567934 RepID=UPI0013E164F6|nr:YciI family protein [Microbacterium sp. 4R-513]QIG40169.1 transcription initiation protein [Microbacterium sp. 4R-513]